MYEQTVVILFRYHGAAHPQVTAVLFFLFFLFYSSNMRH
jgi:hypothetical protein